MPTQLVDELRALIARDGPITFERFMDLALYSPGLGYYTTRSPGTARPARALADFQTSPQVHPAFGDLLARELLQVWETLDRPVPFRLAEPGAGDGTLAGQIVTGLREREPSLVVEYHAVDVGWPQRDATPEGEIHWWSSLAALRQSGAKVSCIVSNEFFDALPVHRVAWLGGRLREVYVDWGRAGIFERLGEPSHPALVDWLADRGAPAEGWRGEICLRLEPTLRELASLLDRGLVLTIDYGRGPGDDASRPFAEESVVAYHRQQWSDELYQRVGDQDLTSHVDFDALLRLGRQLGLEPAGALTQRDFLLSRGLADNSECWAAREPTAGRQWQARLALAELIRPAGLGRLKVVAQRKGINYSLIRSHYPKRSFL
jgi:SAM-dependent MidA family methyltransferase